MLDYLDAAFEGGRVGPPAVGAELVRLSGSDIGRSLALFQRALSLDPDNKTLQWGLMRVSLRAGKTPYLPPSINALQPRLRSNAWLYQDLLLSLSHAGRHERVVALFEEVVPPHTTDVIRDSVAYAYLELGADGALDRARQLRPGDLYVNYHLWKAADESGDVSKADLHRDRLVRFPLAAVLPADSRLLEYAAAIIPELFTQGIWDEDQLLNLVALLVWQNYRDPEVLLLTQRLSALFPTNPDWLFYQAEVYHRRGQFQQAEELYLQAISLDPNYAPAYLRLATVIESQVGATAEDLMLSRALVMYQQYFALGGDDLLGLAKLDALCAKLASPGEGDQLCRDMAGIEIEVSRLGSQDEERMLIDASAHSNLDLGSIVSALLNLSDDKVDLGPNLIENGGFEEWVGQGLPGMIEVKSRPEWWNWTEMFSRAPFNSALFIGNSDALAPFEGEQVARIDGQWLERQEGLEAVSAGYWQLDERTRGIRKIEIAAEAPYLLSFTYRTKSVADSRTTAWVASPLMPGSLWYGSDPLLPATGGAWYRFLALGWNHTQSTAILQPLLRLYATGSVSFDDVTLQSIHLGGERPDDNEVKLFILRASSYPTPVR